MDADCAPAGATHGFDPLTHTRPTVALPFSTPFTAHVTAVSGEFVTFAANDCRCPGDKVAALGVTITVTALVIVKVEDALVAAPPVVALAVA